MLERRKFIRIPLSGKITYEIADIHRAKSSLTKNVSKGGIDFFADDFIPIGTILRVQFALKEFSYSGFVRVIWVIEDTKNEKYEIGAQFMSTPKTA